jgi:hypothetical protein
MTDDEMLELAALAVDPLVYRNNDGSWNYITVNGDEVWDPFKSSIDADRLAVRLARTPEGRRAIVRAAAEVGRQLKEAGR